MGAFDTSLGALLIGIFFNTFLYGIVTFQYTAYFNTKFNDPLWIRALVFALFLLDTVHSASVIYMAWVYAVENYANPLSLLFPVWPYPFTVIVTAITAFLTQIFLSYRIFRLTNRRIMYTILMTLACGTFVLGLVCGAKAWQTKLLTQVPDLKPILVPWLCLEVGVDAGISVTLLYSLANSRTGFFKSSAIINRIMRMSIQTGFFSGVFSILSLAFFLHNPKTDFFGLFGIPISRVYTNTLMDTLLARETLRVMLNGTRQGQDFDTIQNTDQRISAKLTDSSIQMHVRREITTEVHFDDASSIPQKYPSVN